MHMNSDIDDKINIKSNFQINDNDSQLNNIETPQEKSPKHFNDRKYKIINSDLGQVGGLKKNH